MKPREGIVVMAIAMLMGTASSVYASPTIVFDSSCGFFGINEESSVGLRILKEELELKGYEVKDSLEMRVNVDIITKDLLERANILVIVNSNRKFKREEMNIIKKFVGVGGKLFLVCDDPDSAGYMSDLSREFEAEFLGNYYLGDYLTLNLDFGQVSLFSPISLDLHKKPDILLHTEKIEAKWWPSRWEMPGEPLRKDDFTFFAGIKYGEGKIAFLGDKDVLLNENIKKGDNLSFVLNIFDWLSFVKREDEVTYSPKVLDFTGKGTTSLLIENKGKVDQTLNFTAPSYLEMDISKRNIQLLSGAKELVTIKLNQSDYPFSDFIIVRRRYGFRSYKDYIPVRAVK